MFLLREIPPPAAAVGSAQNSHPQTRQRQEESQQHSLMPHNAGGAQENAKRLYYFCFSSSENLHVEKVQSFLARKHILIKPAFRRGAVCVFNYKAR